MKRVFAAFAVILAASLMAACDPQGESQLTSYDPKLDGVRSPAVSPPDLSILEKPKPRAAVETPATTPATQPTEATTPPTETPKTETPTTPTPPPPAEGGTTTTPPPPEN